MKFPVGYFLVIVFLVLVIEISALVALVRLVGPLGFIAWLVLLVASGIGVGSAATAWWEAQKKLKRK